MINNWVESSATAPFRRRCFCRQPPWNRRATGHDSWWTMMGSGGVRPLTIRPIIKLSDDAGYRWNTNCEQTYSLLPIAWSNISAPSSVTSSDPSNCAGEGWFINQHIVWQVGDEDVAEMNWYPHPGPAVPSSVPDDLDPDAMRPFVAGHRVFLGWSQGPRIVDPAAQFAAPTGAGGVARHRRRSTTSSPAGRGTVFSSWCITPKVPGRTVPFVARGGAREVHAGRAVALLVL